MNNRESMQKAFEAFMANDEKFPDGCNMTERVFNAGYQAAIASQAQQESKPVAWGYAWQCKSVGDWRIEKLGEGCIPPKDTLALYTLPPAPEVCSDGGKCGAGGYCITCPNMPAPEGGE